MHHDAVNGELRGRKGARLAALTSGGAIPETGDYRVVAEPDDTFIGTVNEDWAVESMAGDIFLLGTHSWQIRRVEAGVVRVRDAGDAPPTVPFWMGEAPARTDELSAEVSGAPRRGRRASSPRGDPDGARAWLIDDRRHRRRGGDDGRRLPRGRPRGARRDAHAASCLVLERFFDETGGMQLVVHSPYGGRINRALGLALRKKFCRTFNFELQAAATDNAVVLSLGPHHSFPLADVPRYLSSQAIDDTLEHAILDSPMFQARWRWNLNRSLMVLRFRNGREEPAADPAHGGRRPHGRGVPAGGGLPGQRDRPDRDPRPRARAPDHRTTRCTRRSTSTACASCSSASKTATSRCTSPTPPSRRCSRTRSSPRGPYAFLDDEEFQNRRTNAVTLRRGLAVDLASIGALEPAAIEQVHGEIDARARRRPTTCTTS